MIDDFTMEAPKTRELAAKLAGLGIEKGLLVVNEPNEALYLSVRNLPNIYVSDVKSVDPASLVGSEKVVMTVSAVKQIEESLA